ncbi:RNA polymerase sigma factor [Hwangdonia lutea]|uniref:Sigma-70 family RNA polymerase sigma factor n=1 Tax=Hwangdonia lutea TaxID=3075823 RepID=A0AA97HR55_9FLAO|nr:sigma-70 family RNA polymerase sigma factor [Hwangdonia sp. SCSIO 19198]WOD44626.1 sigma-70 family RNA polymerase sigma factor [Hwangdonia sp. SCSIO 19198]
MEQHFVDALKINDEAVIKTLYYDNRDAFLGFSKTFNIDACDALDIYQEAFLAIRKHAISGKLYHINSSFKTYLFGIGKHLIYKKLKEYAKKQPYNPQLHKEQTDYDEIIIEPTNNLTPQQELLQHYFKQLGESCQQMLTLSFFRGLTNDEIATLKGYDSEAVVRSQKSRCLKTLKNLIKSPLNHD